MYNLHTHTHRCKHAEGKVIKYAEEAEKKGIKILGISDHCPFPDGRWDMHRMDVKELPEYIKEIDDAKASYPDINIITGLEVEWVDDFKNYYDEIIDKYKIQYFIGSVHYFKNGEDNFNWTEINSKERLKIYLDQLIKTMESGYMNFIAHPDAFGTGYLEWDKEAENAAKTICRKAIELDLPLELNGHGYRKPSVEVNGVSRHIFPLEGFWKTAAESGVKILVSSDAHKPEDLTKHFNDCRKITDKFELNLVNINDFIKTFRTF